MKLGRRLSSSNEEKRLEEQRQRVINFKKFFGSEEGQEIMLDLMNRFFILNPLPKTPDHLELARAEGNREVVLYLLGRANTDMSQFDKILKGDFT